MGGEHGEHGGFRYNARLAGEIEERWQERWAREGAFASPGC